MFLGFLPNWVGDVASILSLPAILVAIVTWLLGRKDANRKLIVEEGSLKKSEFDSFTEAQNAALNAARAEASAAKREADEANDRLDLMDDLYDGMREAIHRLRSLVRKVVANASYQMTKDELAEFEATKPLPRPPRIRNH